ncbi:MAG: hypothetical protein HY053_02715 [Proteobacteria bacterium]|nr:hypothetical protein [Pseudomonadota bacterium]
MRASYRAEGIVAIEAGRGSEMVTASQSETLAIVGALRGQVHRALTGSGDLETSLEAAFRIPGRFDVSNYATGIEVVAGELITRRVDDPARQRQVANAVLNVVERVHDRFGANASNLVMFAAVQRAGMADELRWLSIHTTRASVLGR